MASPLPKSLHPAAGKPMLVRILQALKKAGIPSIRVVIKQEHLSLIRPVAEAFKAQVHFQSDPKKGTARSVLSADLKTASENILILNGDHPLITPSDIKKIIEVFYKESVALCMGVFIAKNPGDYGRVVRKNGQVCAVAEAGDLTNDLKNIKEINTGLYMVKKNHLLEHLPHIPSQKKTGEYPLTGLIGLLSQAGHKTAAALVSEDTAFGVNSQSALAFASKKLWTAKLNQLMSQGVIIVDPLNTYIEEDVHIGAGSVIYPGVYLKGRTGIGPFCAVEINSFIADSIIHNSVLIRAGCYLESVEVGAQAVVGPYARLRPGTQIGAQCRVGNFVEMKKTQFGARSKAGHFSYLGDAEVGEEVNIGAGAVTCNLNIDGQKHAAQIGERCFVGSSTQLVAPVKLGSASITAAGSVITKDVPAGTLAIGPRQQNHRPIPRRKK